MCRQKEIVLHTYKHDSKAKKKVTKAIQICRIFRKTPAIREQFAVSKRKGKEQKNLSLNKSLQQWLLQTQTTLPAEASQSSMFITMQEEEI